MMYFLPFLRITSLFIFLKVLCYTRLEVYYEYRNICNITKSIYGNGQINEIAFKDHIFSLKGKS